MIIYGSGIDHQHIQLMSISPIVGVFDLHTWQGVLDAVL